MDRTKVSVLIERYTADLESIYKYRTKGVYTFEGLLWTMLNEWTEIWSEKFPEEEED